MTHPRELTFNVFLANAVTSQSQGLWRHPRDRTANYTDLQHWLDIARTAERGLFDGMFFADQLGYYDTFGGSPDTVVEHGGLGYPMNDPMPLIPAMASVTKHLCFGMTASTAAEHPFAFARRMSTLDHLTGGRVAWNIVTSYLASAARNLGEEGLVAHDLRYDMAEEYMEVVYKLWEGSWEPDARAPKGNKDYFADPSKVHPIRHRGKYYRSEGMHMSEPSPQRTPFLFQAGASARGLEFAARHAEAIFTIVPTASLLRGQANKIRDAVEAAGRARDAVKIMNLAIVVVGETDAQARELYAEYESYADGVGALAYMSGILNYDLSTFPLDEPLAKLELNDAIHGFIQMVGNAEQEDMTLRELGRFWAFGTACPTFVGSAQTVADEMMQWCADSDTDGFNIGSAVQPESWTQIADLLVPELQRRGAYKTAYRDGTMREKYSGGRSGPTLPSDHWGAGFRDLSAVPIRPANV